MRHFQFLALLFITLKVFSAGPELSKDFIVTTSEPYQVIDATSKFYFSDNKQYSYSIKTDVGIVTLQKFDFINMKEVSRKEYRDLPDKNRAIDVIKLNGKFYYIYDSYNKNEKNNSVYVREVNLSEGTFHEEVKLLTTNEKVVYETKRNDLNVFGDAPFINGRAFEVFLSSDSSKIMLGCRIQSLELGDDDNICEFIYYVFDASLNALWNRTIKMPYKNDDIIKHSSIISSDGTSIFLMLFHKATKRLKLLNIKEEEEVSISDIYIDGKLFSNLYLKENIEGNFILLGWYDDGANYQYWSGSNFNYTYKFKGLQYCNLSKQGAVLDKKEIEFPLDFINQHESKKTIKKNIRNAKKGKEGLKNLLLREVSICDDGGLFVLGEEYSYHYNSMQYNSMPPIGASNYFFIHNNLIAVRLDSSGNLLWMKKLPKYQHGVYVNGGIGIRYFKKADKHFIIFKDNLENADISIDEKPKPYQDAKPGNFTAYKIEDSTGNYSREIICNSVDINDGLATAQYSPIRFAEVTNNILLFELYIRRNKNDMTIKVEFTEYNQ